MLVISRKTNDTIVINDEITITVIELRGNKVRLGIEAPKGVSIHRGEVYAILQREKAPKEVPVHRGEIHAALREGDHDD